MAILVSRSSVLMSDFDTVRLDLSIVDPFLAMQANSAYERAPGCLY
jgi:hypothetical protein